MAIILLDTVNALRDDGLPAVSSLPGLAGASIRISTRCTELMKVATDLGGRLHNKDPFSM